MSIAVDQAIRGVNLNQAVVHTLTFRDADGVAYDPSTVTFEINPPSGANTTYTYGTDAALTRLGTGNYRIYTTASVVGTWYARWTGTGPGSRSEVRTGSFVVRADPMA